MKKIILKQTPKDFIVKEIINLKVEKQGNYAYIKLTKENLNTLDAVKILESQLRMPRKFISFAGLKDKQAVTTQYISIQNIKEEQLKNIKHPQIKIQFIGYSSKPISLGTLEANRFTITLNFKPKKINQIVNYFGEQRFSKNNAEIGKSIIKKDFKKAIELIDNQPLLFHLKDRPNDFIGAIKKLDKKLISLYINSYQSYLWNKVASEYLKSTLKKSEYKEHESLIFPKTKSIKNIKIPLISFDAEFNNKTIENIYNQLLKQENIALRDFLIRQFPEQLPITTLRDLIVKIKDFKYKNNKLTFQLPKGSYATILIKHIEAVEYQNNRFLNLSH